MKTPRIKDFDPQAIPPLKSSLEEMPQIQPPPSTPTRGQPDVVPEMSLPESARSPVGTSARATERPPVRTSERIKRTLTRYSFEFFQDQIESIKQFSIQEQLRGEKGNMSRMVREAIDGYISKRMRTEE